MKAHLKFNNTLQLQVLEGLMATRLEGSYDRHNIVRLPFFNFIDEIVQALNSFVKSTYSQLHLFLVEHYLQKYDSPLQVYRRFFGLISMWKKYSDSHEQARLLLSVLSPDRSNQETIKLFLRIRKTILKNLHAKIMQEITLTHQDILTVSHTLFQFQTHLFIKIKIKELWVSLKRKLMNSSTINGVIACEFLMNCIETFARKNAVSPNLSISVNKAKQGSPFKKKVLALSRSSEDKQRDRHRKSSKSVVDLRVAKDSCGYQLDESKFPSQRIEEQAEVEETMENQRFKGLGQARLLNEDSQKRFEQAKQQMIKKFPDGWSKFMHKNRLLKEKLLNKSSSNY